MATIHSRHDHTAGGVMAMSGMSIGVHVPTLFDMQDIFWAFMGTYIVLAAVANIINKVLCNQRITSSKSSPAAAKPKSLLSKAQATLSAIIREYSNYSMPVSIRGRTVYLPTAGPFTLLIGYLVLVVVCTFYALNPNDLLQWEDLGYRAGFIAICQMPLIILLAGKRNIIGFVTGVGYERLAWLHRWVARSLLFSVLLHMFFWFEEWLKYDYVETKLKEDPLTQKGLIASGILLWIVLSSAAPIRGLSYEVFVAQHIISWLAFMAVVWIHVPTKNRIWIILPLTFWGSDRIVRLGYIIYNNISLFHKNRQPGILACKATFTLLDDKHTRITIAHPPISWTPGQHVFLSVPVLAPFTSHPFTIASLATDNTMEFIVRAKKGATKSFFKFADKTAPILPSYSSTSSINEERLETRTVLIDGPYSRIRPLRQFDSVLFIAGSTGATFTVPLLRDLVQTWSESSLGTPNPSTLKSKLGLEAPHNAAVTRHIRFLWVIKNSDWTSWFSAQLENALLTVRNLQRRGMDIDLSISIYITSSSPSSLPSKLQSHEEITNERENALRILSSRDEEFPERELVIERELCHCKLAAANNQFPTVPCTCATNPPPALPTTPRRPQLQTFDPSSSSTISVEKAYNDAVYSYSKPVSREPKINMLSGRPEIEVVINEEAEQARGEMAVVVCGPGGMVLSTKNAACNVSDERGVHKGTGAQGIWVHGEGFGYA
ncbi:related to ferric reductase, NADH/NADPH oxidase and related proteins [Phialocephala subalpina]|uniref:ferric-chelate reductase (NADPH) n=1 Tax=Phialocephala subalpina TaxID=576137 RepID=A0A1L7WFK3_9HELO|nr:related to ferric reductase, NADH/NADPH oxidase and related proteins [Phialocephala subalpina]